MDQDYQASIDEIEASQNNIVNQDRQTHINIELWIRHTQSTLNISCYLQGYYIFQLGIAVLEFIFKWDQSFVKPFILCVFFQNLYHSFLQQAMKRSANKRITELKFLQDLNEDNVNFDQLYQETCQDYAYQTTLGASYSYVVDKHDKMNFIGRLLLLWMWILSNVILIVVGHYFDQWFLIAQVGVGWFIIGTMLICVTLIIVFLPAIYCYINYNEYRKLNRRTMIIQDLRNRVTLYRDIANQINHQPCYICLEEYQPLDNVVSLPCQNNHMFHLDCLEPWVQTSESCPVCRQHLY